MKSFSFQQMFYLLTFLLVNGSLMGQSQQSNHTNPESNLEVIVSCGLSLEDSFRDPCEVFIGVSTSYAEGGGASVVRIVDNSPAAIMDLKKGDVILELDGEPINSPCDLVVERDRNQPGDYFRMTISRDGKTQKVRGQFTVCEQKETVKTTVPEIINSTELAFESFEAYPNPTFGEVNIAFEGAAVPTTFVVTDIVGKVVFQEEVKNFDGFYRSQIHLQNSAAPGAVSLTVVQNGQAVSKNIVLLNRL